MGDDSTLSEPDPTSLPPSSRSYEPPASERQMSRSESRKAKLQEPATKEQIQAIEERNKNRFQMLFAFLICVFALAVVAIVLPLTLNKNDDNNNSKDDKPSGGGGGSGGDDDETDGTKQPSPDDTSSPSAAPTSLRFGQFVDAYLVPIYGEEFLKNTSSPQYQAALWISEEDVYAKQLRSKEELDDRYGLAIFYESLGGADWTLCSNTARSSCPAGSFAWMSPSSVCDWYGVTCNEDGRVKYIIFEDGNGMSGTFPGDFGLLADLEELVLTTDPISGTLPDSWGAEAANMTRLVLSGLALEGAFPENFMGNSQVVTMDLSGNRFTGKAPTFPAQNDTLTALHLSDNLFTGSIPEALWDLTQLTSLRLDGNKELQGTLSKNLKKLDNLQELYVGGTRLGGFIPDEIFGLANITVLSMSGAAFYGPISSSFNLLAATLEELYLDGNKFTGTIPKALGEISGLTVLQVHDNSLDGEMPSEVCALENSDPGLDVLTADCDAVSCSCCTECFE